MVAAAPLTVCCAPPSTVYLMEATPEPFVPWTAVDSGAVGPGDRKCGAVGADRGFGARSQGVGSGGRVAAAGGGGPERVGGGARAEQEQDRGDDPGQPAGRPAAEEKGRVADGEAHFRTSAVTGTLKVAPWQAASEVVSMVAAPGRVMSAD